MCKFLGCEIFGYEIVRNWVIEYYLFNLMKIKRRNFVMCKFF